MDELTSLGLILLLALLAGHLVRYARVPEVTGYILAGVALGPSVLGWVSYENLAALQVLSEVALGLILFSVGSVFEFSLFRRIGRNVLYLTLIESALAGSLVTGGMLLLGQPWQIAGLLGAIAIATAPASTLMVIREVDSEGPLTDTLLGIIAVNNLFCITAYSLVAALIDLTTGLGGAFLPTLYRSVFPLVWQLFGSAALGFLVGLMLAGWSRQVRETGEMLILLAGSILFCVGLSRALDLSPLVASLAVAGCASKKDALPGPRWSTSRPRTAACLRRSQTRILRSTRSSSSLRAPTWTWPWSRRWGRRACSTSGPVRSGNWWGHGLARSGWACTPGCAGILAWP